MESKDSFHWGIEASLKCGGFSLHINDHAPSIFVLARLHAFEMCAETPVRGMLQGLVLDRIISSQYLDYSYSGRSKQRQMRYSIVTHRRDPLSGFHLPHPRIMSFSLRGNLGQPHRVCKSVSRKSRSSALYLNSFMAQVVSLRGGGFKEAIC